MGLIIAEDLLEDSCGKEDCEFLNQLSIMVPLTIQVSQAFTWCIMSIQSCNTKHYFHYKFAMLENILGGLGSLLFSAFESWPIAEHKKQALAQNNACQFLSQRQYF